MIKKLKIDFKDKKSVLALFGILSAVLLTTAASYAWFSYSGTGRKENTISSGSIKFHYQEGNRSITLSDAMPMTDEQGKAQDKYFDFTITSKTSSEIKVPYYITARRKGNDSSLDSSAKLYLTEVNNNAETALTLENNKQVSKFSELSTYTNTTLNIDATKNEKVLYIGEVPKDTANYEKNYRLRMWLDDSATYTQTETGTCSDPTYTTKEDCQGAGEDWTVTATAVSKEFTVTVNVYAEGESDVTATNTVYTPGELVQFDPVANAACTTGETCYKWRIISTDGETNENITLQMDHNLVNVSAWSPNNTSTGPTTALSNLATATSSWSDDLLLNYTYDTTAATNNYGTLTCTNGTCSITGNATPIATGLKARMITGEEVRALTMYAGAVSGTNADNWTLSADSNGLYYFSNTSYALGTNTSGEGDNTLAWLIENTSNITNSGATANTYDSDNYGYWTLSPASDVSANAWLVNRRGNLNRPAVSGATASGGVRPVITVLKSNLYS